MTPRVYLAGPEVFYPDHRRLFAERALLCKRHGLEALVPVDDRAKDADHIYRSNLRLLAACHAVIANITPFRGPHCDPGTAWEIGYAAARSIPVIAFSQVSESLASRISGGDPNARTDAGGASIEPFRLAENLMIVESVVDNRVHDSFEAALNATVDFLKTRRRGSLARTRRLVKNWSKAFLALQHVPHEEGRR